MNNNWKLIKISDFAEVVTGGTPSTKVKEYWDNGTIPWLPSGACRDKKILSADKFITESGLKKSSAKLMPKKTVVIALTGATTGKVGLLEFEASANQSVTGIIPNDKFVPEFLYFYLISIRKKILFDSYGGAQKHISQGYVKNIKVPLPDIPTQHRISEILMLAQNLIDKRKSQIEVLDQLTQSVFLEMFGDPKKNPKQWPLGTIKDLSIKTQYGTSKKADEKNGRYPILRMNNITYNGSWNFSSLKYIDLDDKDKEKYLVKKGELLFNRTNSKELVGKTAVYREDTPMAYAGYLVKLICNEKSNSEFISAYLNSKYGKALLLSMAKNIVGMANINAKELQNIKIYIPPKEIQDKYASINLKIIEKRDLLLNGLNKLEENYLALLQRAFKGELSTKEKLPNV